MAGPLYDLGGAMERLISVMGDSISTFSGWEPPGYAVYFDEQRAGAAGLRSADDTWWAQVARRLGARVLANASYSGSMVAGAGFPAGLSRERSAALRGPLGEVPTDVLVFMGTNDYGWGSARAQAAGRSAATPDAVDLAAVPCGVASGALPSDLDDFEAAYAAMLANIASACPGAALWCVGLLPGRVAASDGPTFTWNLRGIPLGDYNEAIGRAACSKGAVFLDVASYGLDYEATDGTHPTARGMAQIADLVCAAMGVGEKDPRRCRSYATQGKDAPASWASLDRCPGATCVGCVHALDTGNTWRCVCCKGQKPAC